ncbi:hypothetical protein Tco_0764328, partial [Tanacetum coccineum]
FYYIVVVDAPVEQFPDPKKPIYSEVKVTNWIHGLRATKAADELLANGGGPCKLFYYIVVVDAPVEQFPDPKKPIHSEVKVTNWIHGLRATKAADVGTSSKWRRTMFRNEVK